MITATVHASAFTQAGLTNWPIFARSLVNITSGNTANGSCMLRMTWLRISSAPDAPLAVDGRSTMTAGMMAMSRVISGAATAGAAG